MLKCKLSRLVRHQTRLFSSGPTPTRSLKMPKIAVISSVTLAAGYLAYSGYYYFIGGPGIRYLYPEEIRKPLKDALNMKHSYPPVEDQSAPRTDQDIAAAKQRDAQTRAAFTKAIEEARKSQEQRELKDVKLALLLVEYGDWLYGRDLDRDALDVYSEAMRAMLHVPPGSPLPQLLQDKRRRYQLNPQPEVDTFPQKDDALDRKIVQGVVGIGMKMGESFAHLEDFESAETVYKWCIDTLLASCIHSSKDLENLRLDPYSTCSRVRDQLCNCMAVLGELRWRQKKLDEAASSYQALIRASTRPGTKSSDFGVLKLIQDTLAVLVIMDEGDRWHQAKVVYSLTALADLAMARGDDANARRLVTKASRLNLPLYLPVYLVQKLPVISRDQEYQKYVTNLQSVIMAYKRKLDLI